MITNELISEIKSKINDNHKQAITGDLLQGVLVDMVKSLCEVYPQTYTDEEKAQARANIDALSNYDGEITKEKLSLEVQAILNDVANKQNISDATLATIAKTIVGAINEVYKGGLKDASIATSKIEDGAITDAKIASGAVTTPKIANDAVTTEKVNDGAITEPKLDTDLLNIITSAVQPTELASAIATALASYVAKADIVSITGSATDKVMSQHGVTEAIDGVTNKVTELQTQINGKQDNIDSLSADEKAALLVSLGLGKIGVISQTQTWTQAADKGYDYVMSDLVRGVIPKSNIDLFTKAGAIFNEESGYFELNGLTDISYEEMRSIYNAYNPNPWNNQQGMLITKKIRTGLPVNNNIITVIPFNGLRLCYLCTDIERINMIITDAKLQFNSLPLAWFWNHKLTSIQNIINATKINDYSQAFEQCYSLVDVRLWRIIKSLSFKDCARLSNSSILYMINNEAATSPITITLHNTVYTRCMANADILAALEAHPNVSLASA